MTKIKALLFDKDGTLINFEKSWAAGLSRLIKEMHPADTDLQNQIGQACGFDIETQTFQGGSVFVNGTTADMIEVWQGIVPDMDVDKLYSTGEAIFENLEPYPVCDLPSYLHQRKEEGFLLGVITNASEASALIQLEKLKILHLFDLVLGCDSGFSPKPEPDTILGFCDKFNIDSSEAAMIGDSTHDLHAGRAANVGCNIGVLTGPATKEQLRNHADVVVKDITDITSALFA